MDCSTPVPGGIGNTSQARAPCQAPGVRFVPVQHEGHSSESEEEAERIAQLVS